MRTLPAALFAIAAFAAEPETFRVSGSIVDSESGKPLARARVVLSGEAAHEWSVVTSPDGNFSFDVPRGKYELSAAHRDWGDVYGEPVPGSDSGVAVEVGPDSDTTRLLFRFRAPVAIHGKIVDENGDPVFDAGVQVFYQTVVAGRKRLTSLEGFARSNDFGDYSYSELPAGTYYLAVTGEPWYISGPSDENDELLRSGTPPVPYAAVWFPASPDPNGASPLVIRPGVDFRADFVLRSAAGANIIPRCGAQPCSYSGNLTLHAVGPGSAETLVRPCESGCLDLIPAVPPGRFVLRFKSPQGVARIRIDVHGGDVPIDIVPKPAPTVTGKVTFQHPTDRPRHPLFVNLSDEDSGETATTLVKPDGSFSWDSITAAHARLYLSGSDGFFVARMSVEGAAVQNNVIDIPDGANVRVNLVALGETGGLTGVVNRNGEPAPAALAVLIPTSSTFDPYRSFAVQAATDGSYEFPHVPAGEYVLFAVKDPAFPYAEPGSVLPYMKTGAHVQIRPRESSTANIELHN